MGTTPVITAERRESYRLYILRQDGMSMTPMFRLDEMDRMRSYITTMEQFFDDSLQDDLNRFEPQMAPLSDEEKDEFLQYNYPVHWEDNFGITTRAAFCIMLCSHVEAALNDIAKRVQVIQRCGEMNKKNKSSATQARLSTVMSYKLYFEQRANFSGPPTEDWERMDFIYWIRNAFVHNDSTSNKIGKHPEFVEFLAQLAHVDVHGDYIVLRSGSGTEMLDIAQKFLESLRGEYRNFQSRILAGEALVAESGPRL